jgi:hypothetical protein
MAWSAAYIPLAAVVAEAAAPFNGFTLTQTQRNYIALGVAGLCVTYLLFRSRWRRKADPLARDNTASSSAGTGLAQQRAVERQMQQLLVELSEMTRQVTAQLDTRAAKLELLIHEADEKLAALESARKNEPSARRDLVLFDGPRLTLGESNHDPDATDGSNSAPHPGAASAEPSRERERQHDDQHAREEPNIATLPDPRHAEIYALADEGRPASEIAQRLGRPSGEIELILALRPTGS